MNCDLTEDHKARGDDKLCSTCGKYYVQWNELLCIPCAWELDKGAA